MLIIKRKEEKEVKGYKGVILMPTLYKIYTMIPAERQRRSGEERNYIADINGF